MGEKTLKNIARPVRAYALNAAPAPAIPPVARAMFPSLAVLPFENMSGEPEQKYFVDGIVEDIITALSRFKSFAVICGWRCSSPERRAPMRSEHWRLRGRHWQLPATTRWC
ncbi:hypothetical protein [Rhizobium tibeticum]|uniref:hypothetical protein n=1 Tax=Rhizobium tibeticum TaxID=501024 RepID=UPI003520A19F